MTRLRDQIEPLDSAELPPQNRTTGKYEIVERDIPLGADYIEISLSREGWTLSATAVEASVDLSLDGGRTWISPYLGFTAEGGVVRNKDLVEALHSAASRELPEPRNPNRKLRASVQINITLRTNLDCSVFQLSDARGR